MRKGFLAIAAGGMALGLAMWTSPVNAQGPMYDRVNVNLPYTVTVGDKVLQPGDYVIQQLKSDAGGSRILLIYSDNGMRFETSSMTIPALDNVSTPDQTKVVLHHYGPDYYFDKIWIAGKSYGYEFPLPNSVKSREKERMEPVSVAATYQATPAPDTTATTTTTTAQDATTTSTTTAQEATSGQMTTPPATTGKTTTPATNNQQTTAQDMNSQTMNTQTTTAPTTPAPTTGTMTAQNNSGSMDNNNNATTGTRNTGDNGSANREMPATSAGWLMSLLGGGALSGAGLALRKFRR